MNSLLKLSKWGQSYWLDNLTRGKIKSGELKRRIEEEGLRGITSNPSIFNNAISKSQDYDDQIAELSKTTKNITEIYENLVFKDIQDACDLFRTVFVETDGLDGYVSLEVSPHLANDAEGTMKEARKFFQKVNRPNCFIKIPGTKEGLVAIEQMLYEGININITLLFSVSVYEEVAKAYIRALERRAKENLPVKNIASVASFFLSRIDVLVDKQLNERLAKADPKQAAEIKSLLGKAAIANAKLAYQSFKTIFDGEKWESLKGKDVKFQRPLWASTSTKNPAYSDVMYVEPLIGKHTVNTMPDETISAFKDHGNVVGDTIEQEIAESKPMLERLKKLGIDIDVVTDQLLEEGIKKFNDPFDALMQTIESKIP